MSKIKKKLMNYLGLKWEIALLTLFNAWEQRKLSELTSLITKGTTPLDKTGNGKINFVNVWKYVAPSIFAASIIESGMLFRYCFKKNIIVIFPNIPGMMSGKRVLTQPIFENMTNCGIIILGYGIINPDNNSRNITFL